MCLRILAEGTELEPEAVQGAIWCLELETHGRIHEVMLEYAPQINCS